MNINANGYWYRYSNTLLVSLNNRISIREASRGTGALLASGTRPASTAKDGPSIVRFEIERQSYVLEERKQSGESEVDDGRKGVNGKCYDASFPVPFQYLDLINRFCVILILNGRTSWTIIAMTGSTFYFCTVTYERCSRHRRPPR